jgi:sulfatase maturation enzyme AslB (radical SAM superfamily)
MIEKNIDKMAAESAIAFEHITVLEKQNSSEAKNVISRLIEYFEAVCIKFENLKEHFEYYQSDLPKEEMKSKRSKARLEDSCKSGQLMQEINDILGKRESRMKNRFSKAANDA